MTKRDELRAAILAAAKLNADRKRTRGRPKLADTALDKVARRLSYRVAREVWRYQRLNNASAKVARDAVAEAFGVTRKYVLQAVTRHTSHKAYAMFTINLEHMAMVVDRFFDALAGRRNPIPVNAPPNRRNRLKK